ncbi:MAG: MFS transporter, partial [Phycisphaerae bacterium]
VIWVVQLLCMDMKNSTIALLPIDLVPRRVLARMGAVGAIPMGILTFLAYTYGMRLTRISEYFPYLLAAGVMIVTTLVSGLTIKEPPIRKQATEPFKPWSAPKVGCRDKRILLLMFSIPLVMAPNMMFGTWIWLYAQNTLGFVRDQTADCLRWSPLASIVLAFPLAWMADRINPYRMAAFGLLLQYALLYVLLTVHSATGIIGASLLLLLCNAFVGAASIMVARSAHPAEVGSVTSSLALINNMSAGTLVALSGCLIEGLGKNYHAAFIMGTGVSTLGFIVLLFYRSVMIKGGPLQAGEVEGLQSTPPADIAPATASLIEVIPS